MRLLLCLNNDFLANYALNLLWDRIRQHDISIVLSNGIGAASAPKAAVFGEWGKLERKLVSEAAPYRTFWQLAAGAGGEAREFSNINSADAVGYVKNFNPDVIVAIRYGHIFKSPLFNIPRHGILNLHAGLLPQYRGIYASFWAMLRGERDIGCTLHYVRDAGIDIGDIIEEQRKPADYNRSVLWNIAMLYDGAADMIVRALSAIERDGAVPAVPQRTEGGAYYPFPLDADIVQFARQGGTLYEERDYAALLQPYGMAACQQTA